MGRIFSSLSFISCLVHFFSHPLYALIYDSSLETFPGAFMVFTGLIIFLALAIMVLVKFLFRRSDSQTTKTEGREEDIDLLSKSEKDDCSYMNIPCARARGRSKGCAITWPIRK